MAGCRTLNPCRVRWLRCSLDGAVRLRRALFWLDVGASAGHGLVGSHLVVVRHRLLLLNIITTVFLGDVLAWLDHAIGILL